ncbi:hypothetical protein A1O1_01329 [Capronia coronata CBS 617.96]|uniref:Uncharacterized protein n=1 Tax=Capronia coronata CBS 617.96 TaxID=1182541 RepID=W9YUJ9_9EURO|nr:uncharacterized protein A1O1_01329 [Capronia coronata CBS 617.96]EXJ96203.1 hypothetical protein A1O1_01329 [Capronia coronata CBS 617.96]
MAGLSPLPTHHLHSSTRLSHREAHTFLSTFLERADTDAAYRPDSTLTERGPQAVSTTASSNLTLHHLKRILLGMEGKRVGGDLAGSGVAEGDVVTDDNTATPATATTTNARTKRGLENDAESQHQNSKKSKRKLYNDDDSAAAAAANDSDGPAVAAGLDGEGWQDKDAFALAQTEEDLEATADDRHPGADLDQPADEAEEVEMMRVQVEGAGAGNRIDKEERKRLKKLRNKENQVKKAEESKKKSRK